MDWNILLLGYLSIGVIAALVIIMVWLRSKFTVEDASAMDGEDGCVLVIALSAVFFFLVFFWLPTIIALKISSWISNSENETEDENES